MFHLAAAAAATVTVMRKLWFIIYDKHSAMHSYTECSQWKPSVKYLFLNVVERMTTDKKYRV